MYFIAFMLSLKFKTMLFCLVVTEILVINSMEGGTQ